MASNAPYPWDERNEYLRRQIAQAQALRAQASNVPSQGQMVGGQYIAPSWAQMMVPLANALRGHMEEQAATKEQGDLMQQMQQDYQGWMQSRPQPQTVNLEGPTMDGSSLTGQVPPTQQQNMEWASRGMANPLSRTLAGLYAQDALIREPEREEQRQFRKEESALDRAARERAAAAAAQARLEEITLRLEDRKLDRESRERLAGEANQLRRDLANVLSADRHYAVDNRPAASSAAPKPVPNPIMKTLQGTEAQAEGLANVSSTFKPEYGGVSGAIDKFSGTWNPFSGKSSEAAASWWKDYENQAALTERHEKFGTALSAGEQAAWKAATIAPGMKPDVIAKNLATRAKLARELHNRIRNQYIKGGYPSVGEAFEAFEPRQAPPVAAEPPVMNSPEEAAKLPPGTQFRTPDGQLRVRQ